MAWQQENQTRKRSDKKKSSKMVTKSVTLNIPRCDKRSDNELEGVRRKRFVCVHPVYHSQSNKNFCFRNHRSKTIDGSSQSNALVSLINRSTVSSTMRRHSTASTQAVEHPTISIKSKTAAKKQSNRFKTGGIVATACVKPVKRSKKSTLPELNADHGAKTESTIIVTVTPADDNQAVTSSHTVKDLVKKVKTKFKKKKNKNQKT